MPSSGAGDRQELPPATQWSVELAREPRAWVRYPRPGDRQNPTGTIRSMSWRSPEPCRHRSPAPHARGSDPGARRQVVRDIAGNIAGARDSLDWELVDGHEHVQLGPERRRREASAFDKRAQLGPDVVSVDRGRRGRNPCQRRGSHGRGSRRSAECGRRRVAGVRQSWQRRTTCPMTSIPSASPLLESRRTDILLSPSHLTVRALIRTMSK